MDPGAFSGQRQGWKTPKRTLWQCSASVCVLAGVYCWEICFGVSRSRELDLLSVLLIYPRIFLHIFIVYRLLVGFLHVWLCSAICSCVLVVLIKLSVLAKWLAIERPLWGHLYVMRLSPKTQVEERVCVYFSFVWFVYVAVCPPPSGPTQYIFHTPMAWYSLYVLKVPLNTKQTNTQSLVSCLLLIRKWTSKRTSYRASQVKVHRSKSKSNPLSSVLIPGSTTTSLVCQN